MKRMLITATLTGALLSAGAAGAAPPLQLTDEQMDSVAAAGQSSVAAGYASALVGTAYVKANTSAYSNGPVRITRASALSVATGVGARASASAASTF